MNDFRYGLRGFFHSLRSYFPNIWRGFLDAVLGILKLPWAILGPFILPLAFALFHTLHTRAPRLWEKMLSFKTIRILISRLAIRKFGNIAKPRPHPFSMFAGYPTWTGFINRKYTGRHLGQPAEKPRQPNRPPALDLEQLFLRPVPTGAQINDVRSNLLFATFAQWFTDSFLRTSHKLHYDDAGNAGDGPDGTLRRCSGRERENDSNHEIDLCQIYGMNEKTTLILRLRPGDAGYDPEKHKGTLKSQLINGEEFPASLLAAPPDVPACSTDDKPRTKLNFNADFEMLFEDERLLRLIFSSAISHEEGYETLFACGLEHGNSTIGNTLFNTIFLRHHNYVARTISQAHPLFDDDEVFEKTRNVMIVLLLKIVICDYVRHISPLNLPFTVPPKVGKGQSWYRRNRIQIEFNLLYRWHSLVPDAFPFLENADDPGKNFSNFRHNNKWLVDKGLACTLKHFTETPAGKMTLGNTPRALRMVKRDTLKLMRNANLQSYNAYRTRFGLHPARNFEEVTGEKVIAAELSDLYGGKIEDLEFYVGMVAERHRRGGIMGDLMFNMVAHDALTHALTNPLLADEMWETLPGYKKPGEHVFSKAGTEIIEGIETLDDLLRNVVPQLPADHVVGFRRADPGVQKV